ncbi:MAG TPA: DUF559 domain-containing protein [Mycobacteriales bacterium]|jgi:very-short-patch-repair endonuclease|nr:DUF559 domain-containing protein [Mycobacteriales bacterium]
MAVVAHRELVAQLGGRYALARALECGQWQRLLHGVYTDGTPDLRARAEAARLVLPAYALVAGRSALWLCGAKHVQDPAGLLEVLVPRGRVVPRGAGLRVREGLIEACDRGSVSGVPCLLAARAAVDVARGVRLTDAVTVLDAALHAGICTPAQLVKEVDRAAGLRGVQTVRVAVPLADARAESPPESVVRVVLALGGLRPVPQHVVRDAAGRIVARLDLALVEQRIAVEYDGRAAHESAEAFVRDRERQNDLVALGWRVLRFTAADLAHPDRLLARVRALAEAPRTTA